MRRAASRLWLPLYLVAPFAVCLFTLRHGIAVPHNETMLFFPPTEAEIAADWRTLITTYREHLVLFPNILFIPSSIAWPWTSPPHLDGIRLHLTLNVCYAAVIALLLVLLLRRTHAAAAQTDRHLIGIVAVMLTFSLAAWQNWMFLSAPFFFPTIMALAAVHLLLGGNIPRRRFLLALACAAGSSFSFGVGLATWPALLPLAWISAGHRRNRMARLAAWCAGGLLCGAAIMLFALQRTDEASLAGKARGTADIAAFFLTILGRPLTNHGPSMSVLLGLALLLLTAFLVRIAWQRRHGGMLAWTAVAAYGIGAAAIITAGRVGIGPMAALESRYISLTVLVPIGALGALSLMRCRLPAAQLLALMLAAAHVVVAAKTVDGAVRIRSLLRQGRACLETPDIASDACMRKLLPGWPPGMATEQARIMYERGYVQPFSLPQDVTWGEPGSDQTLTLQRLQTPGDEDVLLIGGSARTTSCVSPRHVLITLGPGRTVIAHTAAALPGLHPRGLCRPDEGWAVEIDEALWPGLATERIDAWVLDEDGPTLRHAGSRAPQRPS